MSWFTSWMESIMKKIDWLDVGLIKWGVFCVALLVAKLWPGILALDWYWYLALAALFLARPVKRAYF